MDNNINTNNSNHDEINFGRILRLILLQSKLILSFIILGIILGTSLLLFSNKTYEIKSSLQIYTDNSGYLSSSTSSDIMIGTSASSDVELLVNLYKTRKNIIEIIKKFNLNIIKEDTDDIKLFEFNYDPNKYIESENLIFHLKKETFSVINEDSNKIIINGQYDKLLSNDVVTIRIKNPNLTDEKKIAVTYINPSLLYNAYYNQIILNTVKSNNWASSEGFINISHYTQNPEQGINILNYANDLFINQSIEFETEKAKRKLYRSAD